MPIVPTTFGETGQLLTWYDDRYAAPVLGVPNNGPVLQIPLVPDETPLQGTTIGNNQTLRDLVQGQEWMCDRVVGKVWASAEQTADDTYVDAILVCMAMAVLPVQDDNPGVPAMPEEDYAPLNAANTMGPWFWRRTWVLQNTIGAAGAGAGGFVGQAQGAQAIWQYGSVMDAGHVDTAPTKRRIRKEQRLFFLIQGAQMGTVVNGEPSTFDFFFGYDFRVHGAMRRASNKSTFK